MTPDDTVACRLCGHETTLAMIQQHLVDRHGYDPDELAEALRTAPVDTTDPRDET